MKRLLAALLSLSLVLGPAAPASSSEGGGRDPVEEVVTVVALSLLINQVLFNPKQLILLSESGAFGLNPPDNIEKFDDKKGGLFGGLLNSTRKKIFKELARQNFVRKVGRAYRIGDMVFVDSMFFDSELDNEATAAGRAALQQILGGGTFTLGPARNPFDAMLEQQILAMMFFFHSTQSMRTIYRLDPKMNEAGGIGGVSSGAPLPHPLAFLAFFAAVASGQAQPIGNVWQIGDKVVIAAPLTEIFPEE